MYATTMGRITKQIEVVKKRERRAGGHKCGHKTEKALRGGATFQTGVKRDNERAGVKQSSKGEN